MIAPTTKDYTELSTIELRTLVRQQGLAKGAAVASARKEDLVALLTGTMTALDTPALTDAASGIRAALSAPADTGDTLADVIARAINGKVNAGLDTDAVAAMIDTTLARWVEEDLPAVIGSKGPSKDDIKAIVAEAFANAPRAGTIINMPELAAPVELGNEPVHFQFAQVLAWLRADVPVWLWGMPGSGKTHLGRQLAKALGTTAFIMSIDETTTANKLLGFQNLVSGDFVPGWLYEPFKNGGLVCIDEIDTGNPGILAALNALISNGHYLFPNGETVEKHAAFRVIAFANTKGTGAVAGFTARQRLDAATLNRFGLIEFTYDAGLELQIACGIASETPMWKPSKPATPAQCEAWVRWVQRVREAVGKNVLISPRPSLLGVRALRAGVPVTEVADALIFALCADDTVEIIKDRCGAPEAVVGKGA